MNLFPAPKEVKKYALEDNLTTRSSASDSILYASHFQKNTEKQKLEKTGGTQRKEKEEMEKNYKAAFAEIDMLTKFLDTAEKKLTNIKSEFQTCLKNTDSVSSSESTDKENICKNNKDTRKISVDKNKKIVTKKPFKNHPVSGTTLKEIPKKQLKSNSRTIEKKSSNKIISNERRISKDRVASSSRDSEKDKVSNLTFDINITPQNILDDNSIQFNSSRKFNTPVVQSPVVSPQLQKEETFIKPDSKTDILSTTENNVPNVESQEKPFINTIETIISDSEKIISPNKNQETLQFNTEIDKKVSVEKSSQAGTGIIESDEDNKVEMTNDNIEVFSTVAKEEEINPLEDDDSLYENPISINDQPIAKKPNLSIQQMPIIDIRRPLVMQRHPIFEITPQETIPEPQTINNVQYFEFASENLGNEPAIPQVSSVQVVNENYEDIEKEDEDINEDKQIEIIESKDVDVDEIKQLTEENMRNIKEKFKTVNEELNLEKEDIPSINTLKAIQSYLEMKCASINDNFSDNRQTLDKPFVTSERLSGFFRTNQIFGNKYGLNPSFKQLLSYNANCNANEEPCGSKPKFCRNNEKSNQRNDKTYKTDNDRITAGNCTGTCNTNHTQQRGNQIVSDNRTEYCKTHRTEDCKANRAEECKANQIDPCTSKSAEPCPANRICPCSPNINKDVCLKSCNNYGKPKYLEPCMGECNLPYVPHEDCKTHRTEDCKANQTDPCSSKSVEPCPANKINPCSPNIKKDVCLKSCNNYGKPLEPCMGECRLPYVPHECKANKLAKPAPKPCKVNAAKNVTISKDTDKMNPQSSSDTFKSYFETSKLLLEKMKNISVSKTSSKTVENSDKMAAPKSDSVAVGSVETEEKEIGVSHYNIMLEDQKVVWTSRRIPDEELDSYDPSYSSDFEKVAHPTDLNSVHMSKIHFDETQFVSKESSISVIKNEDSSNLSPGKSVANKKNQTTIKVSHKCIQVDMNTIRITFNSDDSSSITEDESSEESSVLNSEDQSKLSEKPVDDENKQSKTRSDKSSQTTGTIQSVNKSTKSSYLSSITESIESTKSSTKKQHKSKSSKSSAYSGNKASKSNILGDIFEGVTDTIKGVTDPIGAIGSLIPSLAGSILPEIIPKIPNIPNLPNINIPNLPNLNIGAVPIGIPVNNSTRSQNSTKNTPSKSSSTTENVPSASPNSADKTPARKPNSTEKTPTRSPNSTEKAPTRSPTSVSVEIFPPEKLHSNIESKEIGVQTSGKNFCCCYSKRKKSEASESTMPKDKACKTEECKFCYNNQDKPKTRIKKCVEPINKINTNLNSVPEKKKIEPAIDKINSVTEKKKIESVVVSSSTSAQREEIIEVTQVNVQSSVQTSPSIQEEIKSVKNTESVAISEESVPAKPVIKLISKQELFRAIKPTTPEPVAEQNYQPEAEDSVSSKSMGGYRCGCGSVKKKKNRAENAYQYKDDYDSMSSQFSMMSRNGTCDSDGCKFCYANRDYQDKLKDSVEKSDSRIYTNLDSTTENSEEKKIDKEDTQAKSVQSSTQTSPSIQDENKSNKSKSQVTESSNVFVKHIIKLDSKQTLFRSVKPTGPQPTETSQAEISETSKLFVESIKQQETISSFEHNSNINRQPSSEYKRNLQFIPPYQSSSSSTSIQSSIDDSLSDGEINSCRCSVSIGEIHLCKYASNIKKRVNFAKRYPDKLLQDELGVRRIKVNSQRKNLYCDNMVSYIYSTDTDTATSKSTKSSIGNSKSK